MMIHFLSDSMFALIRFLWSCFVLIYTTFNLQLIFLSNLSNQLLPAIMSLHSFGHACIY